MFISRILKIISSTKAESIIFNIISTFVKYYEILLRRILFYFKILLHYINITFYSQKVG